jgi:hypothetical protein
VVNALKRFLLTFATWRKKIPVLFRTTNQFAILFHENNELCRRYFAVFLHVTDITSKLFVRYSIEAAFLISLNNDLSYGFDFPMNFATRVTRVATTVKNASCNMLSI